ncbi:MAG: hypothetical protein A2015_10790 [Spirochaetes bacterium GWF1_31_7]|nr:MAG: hypothetical protein A2Y30_12925 [Spirochaetes bacterium GWE1_32_154]OHD48345.1 MAG: hypothetical protein A2015_10790 [Spirochaetes bacterium GWF1_31_7]OHD51620.1 MAG: hypothetical protein A2Y29_15025 [Spirochaetes bacterium GWE2_31_10]OHD81914.1 MAG: hypothetical protein A2355_16450 [Spirochaetes bacterium RIFOXYB1_FULL_32_8]HBD96347.1 EamA/RhaT family transporter [Spirochaetia bacterium]
MIKKPLSIFLMIVSSLSLACMGASVKYAGDIPLFQKVFMRDSIVVIVALIVLLYRRKNPFGHAENRMRLTLRGLSGFIGVTLYFYSVNQLLLADATIINKLSPFFTTLFAVLLLKEKIPRIQMPALILGLIGGIFVIKPQFSLETIPAFAGLLGAVVAGFSYAMVLNLTNKEDPFVVVFYFSFSSVILSLPIMIFTYSNPGIPIFVSLLLTGVFAAIGQITLTYSYKYSKTSDVSIYSYTLIIFSLIIGYIFWNEIPDYLSMTGGVLIIISSILVYISYKIKKNKQAN